MPVDDNKRTVEDYLETVWNHGDIEGSDRFLDPDYRRYLGNAEPLDIEGQRRRLHNFRNAFPDARLIVEQMIGEGDLVAFRFTLHGTHRGEFQGIEPTGRRIQVPGLDLVRLSGGKLVEHWGSADMTALKAQIS